jgi:hypothetical protein
MHKKTSYKEYAPETSDDSTSNADTFSSQSIDREKLTRIGASVIIIQEKIDQAYNHLCMILPKINMEIYRTFKKAFDTLDFLSSQGSNGKIDSTLTYIENLLETVNTNVLHVLRQDSRIYEVMEILKNHFETIAELEQEFSSANNEELPQEIRMRYRELISIKDDLINNIKTIQSLEETMVLDIDSHIHKNIKSLEYTLSSMIFILKDLITRSNSTKKPILRIISDLQTHDIVNQDINNISHGLSKIQSLGDHKEDQNKIIEEIFFQERVSLLSSILMKQLILAIRNHGSRLTDEIDQIEKIVVHVKEDKDNIADFLLLNEQRESTLDIVSLEISQMLSSILSKLITFANIKESRTDLFSRLVFSGNRLEQQMSLLQNSGGVVSDKLSFSIHKIISGIKYLNYMFRYENDLVDIDHLIQDYMKAVRIINFNLESIKALFIESIEGIDNYSKKCMDSISRFRHDINSLLETLDGSDHLLDELKEYSCSISSIRQKFSENENHDQPEITTSELHDLLYRLENPHCNALKKSDENFEEGITFF